MFKIGVRAHDVGKLAPKELSAAVQSLGFDGVQLVFPKAFGQTVDEVNLQDVKLAFKDNIMLLGAYFNMIHPDHSEVIKGIHNFHKNLKAAKLLGVSYVATETGSLMGSPWGYVKENHSDASFDKVVEVTRELLDEATNQGVNVLIEGAWNHTIYSPKRLKQLVDVLDHPNLYVIIDPYNFLNMDNYTMHVDIFKEALELLKNKIKIIHLKDFIVEDNKLKQVGLGQGMMNYQEIIGLLKQYQMDVDLIFEGVKQEDMHSSMEFIKNIIKNKGDN